MKRNGKIIAKMVTKRVRKHNDEFPFYGEAVSNHFTLIKGTVRMVLSSSRKFLRTKVTPVFHLTYTAANF